MAQGVIVLTWVLLSVGDGGGVEGGEDTARTVGIALVDGFTPELLP